MRTWTLGQSQTEEPLSEPLYLSASIEKISTHSLRFRDVLDAMQACTHVVALALIVPREESNRVGQILPDLGYFSSYALDILRARSGVA